jgi:ATP-dependent DNA ligase
MGSGLLKKTNANGTMALRKRNGMMHVIVSNSKKELAMYGSIMLPGHKNEPGIPWLERYPMIYDGLIQLADRVPPKTILLGELVTVSTAGWVDDEGLDVDDFEYVESIVKSKMELAREKQTRHGHLGYCIWDIAFWGGDCLLQTMIAGSRLQMANDLARTPEGQWIYPYLRYPETFVGFNETELLAYAKKKKWEGFVVIDPECAYEDKAYNYHGKAERPKEVGKLKPTLEIDVIAYWDPDNDMGVYGKGKKSVGVGSAAVYLWDPVKQEEVYICDVGGGLTDAQVKEFANPRRYPKVWVVEFANWTPKGAMFHPVFLRERDDKTPEECTVDQRPALESEDEE